jgi:hypothetical protein
MGFRLLVISLNIAVTVILSIALTLTIDVFSRPKAVTATGEQMTSESRRSPVRRSNERRFKQLAPDRSSDTSYTENEYRKEFLLAIAEYQKRPQNNEPSVKGTQDNQLGKSAISGPDPAME